MAVGPVTHVRHTVAQGRAGSRRRRWERSYRFHLLAADGTAALLAALAVHAAYGRWAVALGLPPAWIAVLYGYRAYDRAALGLGSEEYRRVLRGAVALPALSALAYWTLLHDSRLLHDMMLAAAPTAGIALLVRFLIRRRLHWRWGRGRDRNPTLLVGPSGSVVELMTVLRRGGAQELTVAGACLTDPHNAAAVTELGVPVVGGVGGVGEVADAIGVTGSSVVVVLPAPEIDAAALVRLSWSAAAEGADFLLMPAAAEVAASRLVVRPHNGVPLLHVRAPRLSSIPRLPKELAERLLAAVLLLVLAPLMLVVALVVRLDSAGPALFRQRRVGRYGEQFTMLKFRTMRQDATEHRAELDALNQNADGLLFKVRKDPRITRVGSALRRYSIDELPQLLNVLGGHMSLVGPRPSLPEEADAYTHEIRRRLLVKPGLTGLWQVSGRSDLPWDEAVRLDLSYVDNWSLVLDLTILLRTGPAVARGRGAY